MAGEFGNETATATMKVAEKTMEALMKLLKFLMSHNERALNKEKLNAQKHQTKLVKEQVKTERLQSKLDKKRGYVRAKQLYECGEDLRAIGIKLSPDELRKFDAYAKSHNLVYTSVSDKAIQREMKDIRKEVKAIEKEYKVNGKFDVSTLPEDVSQHYQALNKRFEFLDTERKDRIILVRNKDLHIVKDITDRMNVNIHIENIEDELSQLGPDDTLRAEELKLDKEVILRGEFSSLNGENNQIVFEELCGKMTEKSLSFERAVQKMDARPYQEETCYMCERTNPHNYISADTSKEVYNDRTFTKTDYRVFNNENELRSKEFSHGNFSHFSRADGDNSSSNGVDHWANLKEEMKTKGGFTDDVLVFNSKDEFLQYQTLYKEHLEKCSTVEKTYESPDGSEIYTDCKGAINQLEKRLEENGYTFKDGNLISLETGEIEAVVISSGGIRDGVIVNGTIEIKKDLSGGSTTKFMDCLNIAKQISNYGELNKAQVDLAMEKSLKQTDPKTYSENNVKDLEEVISRCKDVENGLKHESEQIQGAAVIEELDKSFDDKVDSKREELRREYGSEDKEKGNEKDSEKEGELSLSEWKNEIEIKKMDITPSEHGPSISNERE